MVAQGGSGRLTGAQGGTEAHAGSQRFREVQRLMVAQGGSARQAETHGDSENLKEANVGSMKLMTVHDGSRRLRGAYFGPWWLIGSESSQKLIFALGFLILVAVNTGLGGSKVLPLNQGVSSKKDPTGYGDSEGLTLVQDGSRSPPRGLMAAHKKNSLWLRLRDTHG